MIARPLLCVLLMMPAMLMASGVYRWTDDNGKVHFSSTPPPQAAGREEQVAETTPKVADDLRGFAANIDSADFEGERDGLTVRLSFHDNGYFVESVRQGGRSKGSFVGRWTLLHRLVDFRDVSVYRPGVENLPPPAAFTIEFYREGVLKVLHDDGSVAYYRKKHDGSRLSLPAELR